MRLRNKVKTRKTIFDKNAILVLNFPYKILIIIFLNICNDNGTVKEDEVGRD